MHCGSALAGRLTPTLLSTSGLHSVETKPYNNSLNYTHTHTNTHTHHREDGPSASLCQRPQYRSSEPWARFDGQASSHNKLAKTHFRLDMTLSWGTFSSQTLLRTTLFTVIKNCNGLVLGVIKMSATRKGKTPNCLVHKKNEAKKQFCAPTKKKKRIVCQGPGVLHRLTVN